MLGWVFFEGTAIFGYWKAKQHLKCWSRSEVAGLINLRKNELLWIGSSSSDWSFNSIWGYGFSPFQNNRCKYCSNFWGVNYVNVEYCTSAPISINFAFSLDHLHSFLMDSSWVVVILLCKLLYVKKHGVKTISRMARNSQMMVVHPSCLRFSVKTNNTFKTPPFEHWAIKCLNYYWGW